MPLVDGNRRLVVSAATPSRTDEVDATRSPSTAPASTDASWSASPTSTSRVVGRSASSSRAIIVSDTIEASSTTTTSAGSRLVRSCRNRLRASGRHPSSRCSVVAGEVTDPSPVGIGQRGGRRPHRLLQPGRRLAGRRGQPDPPLRVLLLEQGQQPADRRRLAGPRPAGQHADPRPRAGLGRRPLVGLARRGEQPVQSCREHGVVQVVGSVRRPRGQLTRDLLLLVPVPRQPEPCPADPQRPAARRHAEQRARRAPRHPVVDRRPVQRHLDHRRLAGLVDVRAGRRLGGREVEHHRTVPGRPHHQRRGEQHRLVGLAAEPAEPLPRRGRRRPSGCRPG